MKGMIEARAMMLKAQSRDELYSAVEIVCSNAGFRYESEYGLAENAMLAQQLERRPIVELLNFAQTRERVLK